MSLDTETRLRELLTYAARNRYVIQTVEISHSAMSKTFYLWREPYEGTITTEDGVRTVEPLNLDIKPAGHEGGHMDQQYEIRVDTTIEEVEDSLRTQLDLIPVDTLEKIRCVYREYISDDLSTYVARGVLEVERIAYQTGAALIAAVFPRYNLTRTGEVYTARGFPMLRAFL